MANAKIEALFTENTHACGVVNTSWSKSFTNGCKLTVADADNYTIVELAGYNEDGVALCKPLTATTVKGLLLTTPEEETLYGDGELQGNYTDFYNAVGDMCNLTIQEEYVRLEVTNFTKNAGLATIVPGNVAHFDATTKKYIVSDATAAHADYATAGNKYEVVGVDTDFGYNVGVPTIRLMCK
jgi:hypothetical protein